MFSRKFIFRAIAVILLYIAITSYIFTHEEKFFFQHNEIAPTTSYPYSETYKELEIPINQEINLHGLLFIQSSQKGLVLLFPSGEYDAMSYELTQNYLYQQGYSLLIPDYRATGKSTSVYHSDKDIYSDAEQWYKMAKSIADTSSLIVYGQDFGSGIAAWVAGTFPVDMLILENPYYSWQELMLKKYFWWLPHTWFTQYEIPLWEFLRKSTNKTLIFSATDYSFIKHEMSLRLIAYLKPGDQFVSIEGEYIEQGAEKYQSEIQHLLEVPLNNN